MRRPEVIKKEIEVLQVELQKSMIFYNVKPQDESLRIPDNVKRQYEEHFKGRLYYSSSAEKYFWEDD